MKIIKKFVWILLPLFGIVSCNNDNSPLDNEPPETSTGILWQKIYYEDSNYAYLKSISQTLDGGFIMGGYEVAYSGGPDWWPLITKIDDLGEMVWETSLNAMTVYLSDIEQTADNGYIVVGSQATDENFTTSGVVYKIDGSGNKQWSKLIGGSSHDAFYSIEQTIDGGYILGGQSYSNISGDKTENSQGEADYWIIKMDASGNIEWQNTIGGSGFDLISSIYQTSDKGYIVAGSSDSPISGDKAEGDFGGYDYWILKLDSSGNIQWQKTVGGNGDDKAIDMATSPNGGFVVAGNSVSGTSGNKTENSNGSSDFWLVRFDLSGNIIWQNTIGGSDEEVIGSISSTKDNGFILGGSSRSAISGDKIEASIGESDYWLIKILGDGSIEWQNTIGGNKADKLVSVNQNVDGSFILGGYSMSDISGDKTVGEANFTDHYWVLRYEEN